MAVLPVWCAGWALGCCGDDHPAVIGLRWKPSLVSSIDRSEPTDADLGWTALEGGDVVIVGEMHVDEERSLQPFIDVGDIKVAAKQLVEGRFTATTRIFFDWHADIDPGIKDIVTVDGVVRNVAKLEPIFEHHHDERVSYIVGYEPPIDVASTYGWLRYLHADALVSLELAPTIRDFFSLSHGRGAAIRGVKGYRRLRLFRKGK